MRGLIASELYLLLRRRSILIVGIVWILTSLIFGLGIPLIVYVSLSGHASATVSNPDLLLQGELPSKILSTVVGIYPTYGSAMLFLLGAIYFGLDFRGQTWGSIFLQEPRRVAVVLAKAVALAVASFVVVLADYIVVLLASVVIAAIFGRAISFPGLGLMVTGFLACFLVGLVSALLGAGLATLTKGMAVAIAIGLGWILAVENALWGVSGILPWARSARLFTPAGTAGSLASYFSAATKDNYLLPGVVHLATPWVSVLILAIYGAIGVVLAALLLRSRDVG